MSDENKTYLGDGAYAEFTGYSIIVYTENGFSITNQIHLEGLELLKLFEFAKKCGFNPLNTENSP